MLPGKTPVWSESSVDEHNLYFARSAIIRYLAVETWRVKTELIIITILHIIILTTSISNLGFKTFAPKILSHTKCINRYWKYTQIFAAKSKQNLLQIQDKTHCKNWAELTAKIIKYLRLPKIIIYTQNICFQSKVCAHLKISAHIKIFASNQNICAHLEISAHTQNICLHVKYSHTSKYSLTSKIFAPYLKYLRIYKIYAPHQECSRLIIYDSNKAAVEIFVPHEKCMRPENRRPNFYYLGSAESPTSHFF